jgi:hypothetical protein
MGTTGQVVTVEQVAGDPLCQDCAVLFQSVAMACDVAGRDVAAGLIG